MQAVGRDGKPFATLVNYAIHPEVLGSSQGILSPDMIGPLYDRITAVSGGTGIFMNGAQGGMVTADVRGPDGKDMQTWEECQRIGHLGIYHVNFNPAPPDIVSRLIQRPDDNEETVLARLAAYHEQTAPLAAWYGERDLLVSIDGDHSIDEVAAAVETVVRGLA